MFKTEYRVVWKRRGLKRKSKRYMSLKAAERRITLMGPEPWKALGLDPDERCCSGLECACGGRTHREILLEQRNGRMHEDDAGMPPIEYVFIEQRPLAKWQPLNRPE
jgi:hypothetical protein